MSPLSAETRSLREALVALARRYHATGWFFGTSGNLSARFLSVDSPTNSSVVITASGCDKGALTADDFVEVDLEGQLRRAARKTDRPSAEASIHTAIYRALPEAGAVLHIHTVASSLVRPAGPLPGRIAFAGLEMLKGWDLWEPDTRAELPVFANHAHVPRIADEVAAWLAGSRTRPVPALLVAAHGITAWGKTVTDAARHLEITEFLCQVARSGTTGGLPEGVTAG